MTCVADSGMQTLSEARREYFARNGFGADGGYGDAWVKVKLGPLPFPFPNSAARVRAVRYHDLHHVVTGYGTNLIGEMEIGAWEIASGCWNYPAAWHLNMSAFGGGVLLAPLRTLRAFARGRRSDNLYSRAFDDELLAMRVGVAREQLGLDRDVTITARDVAAFVPVALGAVAIALVSFVVAAPLAIAAWPSLLLAHRRGGGPRSGGGTSREDKGLRSSRAWLSHALKLDRVAGARAPVADEQHA